mmetsp:Transcript_8789/g.16970  ORF Transcript_8789/g.16970 Transcript_8789/m.16970 type:complete len:555 (-) Transcript_8789:65-1729(-)
MLEEVMRPLYWSGWDAVFKIRCSKGLQVRGMLSSVGSLMAPSSLSGQEDEVEFSVVTPETCIAVTLEHRVGGLPSPNNNNNSSSSNNNFAYVQTALLYTNPWTGDRRVRVSTLAIRVTDTASNVLPSMDFGALAALQLRLNLPHSNYSSASRFTLDSNSNSGTVDPSSPDQIGDGLLTDARHGMLTAMHQVLTAHRTLSIENGTTPSLAPESLRHWPLFVTAAIKSPLLRPSIPRQGRQRRSSSLAPSPRGDERAYYMYHARKVSPACASLLVNPVLLDVNAASFEWKQTVTVSDATSNLKNSPVVRLPSPVPASVSNLAADGIYLLDACFVAYVWIGEEADECGNNNNNENENNANDQTYDNYMNAFDATVAGMSEAELAATIGAVSALAGIVGSIVGSRILGGSGGDGQNGSGGTRSTARSSILSNAGSMAGGLVASKIATSSVRALHQDSISRLSYKEDCRRAMERGEPVPDPPKPAFMGKKIGDVLKSTINAATNFATAENTTNQNNSGTDSTNGQREGASEPANKYSNLWKMASAGIKAAQAANQSNKQ